MSISWKRRMATGFALLAIVLPTSAWPCTLDQLLAMPLEKLLSLRITHLSGHVTAQKPAPGRATGTARGGSYAS